MEFRVFIHPKFSEQCILTLDESCAICYAYGSVKAERATISLDDVIGADLKQTEFGGVPGRSGGSAHGGGDAKPTAARPESSVLSTIEAASERVDAAAAGAPLAVTLYYYPPNKGIRGRFRKRRATTFVFGHGSGAGDAEKFYAFVKAALKRGACSLTRGSRDSERFSKALLVLVNPRSGSGRAGRDFQHLVRPMLDEASVAYEVRVTGHAGHATVIMKDLNLEDWYGVVIVSGDGLAYEVFQGLMARPDWETAIRFPIGILPGGSGNALSCAVNWAAGEPVLESRGIGRRGPAMLHATYVLLKHDIMPMDLVAVDTLDGRVYSFLSVTWGMIADVDIESEAYRSLGNMRFTIGAIARILKLRRYRGKISYLPIEQYKKNMQAAAIVPAVSVTETVGQAAADRPAAVVESPAAVDPLAIAPVVANLLAKAELPATGPSATADPRAADPPTADPPVTAASAPADSAAFRMPSLTDPVPADWKTVDMEFITVAACYQTHLGPDMVISAPMTFDAGYIDLVMLHAKEVTRSDILEVFNRLEEPRQPPADARQEWPVERLRVAAFRIDPEPLRGLDGGGNLMVDGERVRFGRIQGHIMPAAAQIMARRPRP